jgi:hypothetical protein
MFIKATSRTGHHEGTFELPAGADRRMARVQRMACAAAYQALGRAGVTTVDGIFSATALGCLEDTERFLIDMEANRGSLLSPLPFMRSTHNTMAGQLALLLKVHGPNLTFSQSLFGLHAALIQTRLHLLEDPKRTMLVFAAEEDTPLLSWVAQGLDPNVKLGEGAEALVLSGEAGTQDLARIEKVIVAAPSAGPDWWKDLHDAASADHVFVVTDRIDGFEGSLRGSLPTINNEGLSGARTPQVLAQIVDGMHTGSIKGRVLLADRTRDQQGAIVIAPC